MRSLPPAKSGKNALEIAISAARLAGDVLVANFGSARQVKFKGQGNLVTDADILSEKLILGLLRDEYPQWGIVSEESSASTPIVDYAWVVDPLDGTNNYAFGIPFFCVNIALVRNEDVLIGITYDPVRRELFHAVKGRGVYLNDSSIGVSKANSLQASVIALDLGYSHELGSEMLDVATKLWGRVHSMRLMGSASLGLAYVACGRLGLYFHRYVFPWDIVSGILLVREAGGQVTDWEGRPVRFRDTEIIASNAKLHREFLSEFGRGRVPE